MKNLPHITHPVLVEFVHVSNRLCIIYGIILVYIHTLGTSIDIN